MKIEKIDIQTSNNKHATDIAMLVDKLEFLRELQRLRQKWHIVELYKRKSVFGGIALLDTLAPLSYTGMNEEEAEKRLPEFNKDIDNVLKTFKRGKNFRLVVVYALFTGKIPDGIYQSCYFDLVTINEPEDLSKPEKYQYVIVMPPRTEKQEVEEAFKEFKEHMDGKIKFHSPRIALDSPITKEFTDAVECIEREKKLYNEGRRNRKTLEEIDKAFTKFLIDTKEARDYLLQIGDLDINVPGHRELIEKYHKGNIYEAADITKFKTQKELERTREWYWIRYEGYFNGTEKKPLSYPKILQEWQKNCKINGKRETKDWIDCSCPYCSLNDINIIEQALPAYNRLLNKS